MSFASELANALSDIRSEFGGGATYYMGSIATDLGTVSKGQTNYRFIGDDGGTQVIKTVDWLVKASLLTALPRVGDRITEPIGGVVQKYEVSSVNSEPCYEFNDPSNSQLRIHTLFLGTES